MRHYIENPLCRPSDEENPNSRNRRECEKLSVTNHSGSNRKLEPGTPSSRSSCLAETPQRVLAISCSAKNHSCRDVEDLAKIVPASGCR